MNESSNFFLNETPHEYEAGKLDLPDWSGHSPPRRHVPTDEWLAYCRSNLPRLRAHPGHRQSRLQHGVSAEFRL